MKRKRHQIVDNKAVASTDAVKLIPVFPALRFPNVTQDSAGQFEVLLQERK